MSLLRDQKAVGKAADDPGGFGTPGKRASVLVFSGERALPCAVREALAPAVRARFLAAPRYRSESRRISAAAAAHYFTFVVDEHFTRPSAAFHIEPHRGSIFHKKR